MTIAEEVRLETQKALYEKEAARKLELLAKFELDEKDRAEGIAKAEKSLKHHLEIIRKKAKEGYSTYWCSTDSCSSRNRGYMDRLAELLIKEEFTAEVKNQSRYTPGSGSDSHGSYEWWFELNVSW